MKKIVFVAHDPGGYDAVYPVYEDMRNQMECQLFCIGPSANLNRKFAVRIDMVLGYLHDALKNDEVAVLITGTSWGNHTELDCLKLCQKYNVPTISILDYWSNYASRFRTDIGEHIYPDYYFVMDDLAKKEAIAAGVDEKILYITGHPGLDKFFNTKKTLQPRTVLKKILFLSQPLSSLYGNSLGYNEKTVIVDVINICRELGLKLNIKFHPKDLQDLKIKYRKFEVTGNLEEVLPSYDVVIGMNTMGLLHAVLMGARVISYQPGLKIEDACITNKLGLTKNILTAPDLRQILENVDINNRKNIDNFVWSDGYSVRRVIDKINTIFNARELYDRGNR
ncbi:calponin homology domain-containing protein [Pectinatus frisingensis]|uniref:hypothetical protein n=1 Tax=Pectinatus frisingensis TaxID=865 RepID=UPI0018C79C89|nr:hypothetical protein [Pectinatus frisingensis]